MRSLEAKIVVLGSQGVGKTSVVVRYVANTFEKHVSPTIGASFFTCKMQMDNYRVKLQVWDTAGQERFRSMAPMYYRKANAAMLVYDITNKDTFEDMRRWVMELKKNVDNRIVLCVLGNKCDMAANRQVPIEAAQEYAYSIGATYFETSALANTGVQDVFLYVAKSLIRMCENDVDSGLRVMDSYSSPQQQKDYLDSSSFTLHNNSAETAGVNLREADSNEKQRKGWCC